MKKTTKQPHSNNPIATTLFKKGEIVNIIGGIYQGEEGEIFDEIAIGGKVGYEVIIGGCVPFFAPPHFLSQKEEKDDKEKKPDHQRKSESESKESSKKQVRASK